MYATNCEKSMEILEDSLVGIMRLEPRSLGHTSSYQVAVYLNRF